MAASRNDVDRLTAEVEQLRAERAELARVAAGAVTTCQLGELMAEHFGLVLPVLS